jgi:hypothetical protein
MKVGPVLSTCICKQGSATKIRSFYRLFLRLREIWAHESICSLLIEQRISHYMRCNIHFALVGYGFICMPLSSLTS